MQEENRAMFCYINVRKDKNNKADVVKGVATKKKGLRKSCDNIAGTKT